MQVGKGKDVNKVPRWGNIFMGTVHGHGFITSGEDKTLHMNLVSFSPNARTKWHTHPFKQGLIIVEGKGIVADRTQEYVVEPGDVVHIPKAKSTGTAAARPPAWRTSQSTATAEATCSKRARSTPRSKSSCTRNTKR